jgi:hypothetical protein
MQSRLTTWLMVLGMAIAANGCSTFDSASGKSTVGPLDHHWLKKPPALTVAGDGVMQAAPLTNSPTESVKSTITDLLFILGNEELKQPGRSEERRQQIEQVVRHRVNYGHMAQRALGTPWAGLDGARSAKNLSGCSFSCYATPVPTKSTNITTNKSSILVNNARVDLVRSEPIWSARRLIPR